MEKILLVEDEARIRNIVLDYFTAHGLSCDLARNGEEALVNEARFSNIFIEKRASSCQQSLEKSRLFSYPLLMSEGENSQNVKRIFLRKVVI